MDLVGEDFQYQDLDKRSISLSMLMLYRNRMCYWSMLNLEWMAAKSACIIGTVEHPAETKV